jgi:uncharacterized protein (TIGR00255 family)
MQHPVPFALPVDIEVRGPVTRSMTGFGVADGSVAGGRLQVEIRTVNHRHFNAQIKVPGILKEVEGQLRERLRGPIDRGHVTLAARWTEDPLRESRIRVDVDRARDVLTAMEELMTTLDLDGEVDVGFIASRPEVLNLVARESGVIEWSEVEAVVSAAMEPLLASRAAEGEVLGRELELRLSRIEVQLRAVEERAPERLSAERDRLKRVVAELMDGRELNEDRLAQEIALLAEKLDTTEEIVRLRAHLSAAREGIADEAPVGKRLGFLAQEMLREMNTIGSKANDAPIAHAVIAMKGELEKFREQAENVE